MGQEDGLQETADRVARAKFSLRRSEYFACAPLAKFTIVFKAEFGLFWIVRLYDSKVRPLMWWFWGGLKSLCASIPAMPRILQKTLT